MKSTLRLTPSIHHLGLLWNRCEQAGLSVRPGPDAHSLTVEGDEAAIRQVMAEWDGEGVVTIAP